MVGITAVSINGSPLSSGTPGVVSVNLGAQDPAAKTEEGTLKVNLSGVTESKKAESSESSESSEPAHIQQLREMIKDLQKQLAEQQKQLQAIMASNMEETAKVSAVAAAQSAVSTTMGAIQSATAVLLKALLDSGGSSAGGMVSTSA